MSAFELSEKESNILSFSFYSSTAFTGNQFRMQFKAAAAITGSSRSRRIQTDFIVYKCYTYTKLNSLHCMQCTRCTWCNFLMQPQARARTRNRIHWSSQWSQQKELDSSRNRTAVIIPITIIIIIIIIINVVVVIIIIVDD